MHLHEAEPASKWAEVNTMVDMSPKVPTKRPGTLKRETEDTKKPVTGAKSRMERGANEAAQRAGKREQEYDQNHGTISK